MCQDVHMPQSIDHYEKAVTAGQLPAAVESRDTVYLILQRGKRAQLFCVEDKIAKLRNKHAMDTSATTHNKQSSNNPCISNVFSDLTTEVIKIWASRNVSFWPK